MAIGMFILASSTSMPQIYLFGIIYGTGFGGTVDGFQERALAAVAFDQVDRRAAHNGEDEARKPGAAANVCNQVSILDVGVCEDQHGVQEMAADDLDRVSNGCQVDVRSPLVQ